MRKVCYLSGTRADFGLMYRVLKALDEDARFDLSVLVTGMHLLERYGETWLEIRDSGLKIQGKVDVSLAGVSGLEMSVALGEQVIGVSRILAEARPDVLLLLGDRGEMLAGAIAAVHLNIPIVHVHGGERSGTIDESLRHAISKLAHYHFVAHEAAQDRLIKMGEQAHQVFITGAPGLDDIVEMDLLERSTLLSTFGLDNDAPFILGLFHPVVQQQDVMKAQSQALLDAMIDSGIPALMIMPNSDAGGDVIEAVIRSYEGVSQMHIVQHVPRKQFLSLLAYSSVLVGNSSSGIIEAASLGTPVVNVGGRQQFRERNDNVIDVAPVQADIVRGIREAAKMKGQSFKNIYGDGQTAKRMIQLIADFSLDKSLLEKVNAY